MVSSPFFKKLYIDSLTPFEVLAFSKENASVVKKNNDKDLSYLNLWQKTISPSVSTKKFDEYCTLNNLSSENTLLMTSAIKIEKTIQPPFWVETLEEILSKINLKNIDFNDSYKDKPFYQILFPFVDFAILKLTPYVKKSLSNKKVHISKIVNQLQDAIYWQLYGISFKVLFDEFSKFRNEKVSSDNDSYYRKWVSNIFTDNFDELYLSYPMLARKLTTVTHNYVSFVCHLFEKIEEDKSEIEEHFCIKLKELNHIHLNAGDQHDGKFTVIFEFQNSTKIVYKPSDGNVTTSYNNFLNWVNINLKEELKTFRIINKNNYSWLEFVPFLECNNLEDVKSYYKRAGILLGITYFLNSGDFHFENIIASGNCPVLLDHETILGSDLKFKKDSGETPFLGTVLQSLLLPLNREDFPSYIYGFGSSDISKNPKNSKIIMTKIKNANQDNMKIAPQVLSTALNGLNQPKLNNQIEKLINYQEEFKEGFSSLYKLILQNKNFLLSKDSPIIQFKNLKIRHLLRQTEVYAKILQHLNQPRYLADSTLYGLKLELLSRAYLDKEKKWEPILSSERHQMLSGDIPAFYINSSTNGIVLGENQPIDIFKRNAMDSIKFKLNKASLEDFQDQLDLIDGVIAN